MARPIAKYTIVAQEKQSKLESMKKNEKVHADD